MKKLVLITTALVLTLTFSQCKKNDNQPSSEEGTIMLTFSPTNGNSGSKTVFDPSNVSFAWSGTEYIYVGGSNHENCLGTLSGTLNASSITFTGSITEPTNGEELYFFYLGNDKTGGSVSTLDFSSQDGTIENVTNYHVAIGSTTYNEGSTNYSATLNMAMSIAYFDVSGFVNSNEEAETVCLHGNEVYATATVDYQTGTITGNTKGCLSMGTANAGKYVALIPSTESETTLEFNSDSKTGEMTFLRGIRAGKFYANNSEALTVTANALPAGGALSGAFSVSATKQVYFSLGNLQYNKTSQEWSFMEHQYSVVETPGQNVGDDYANQNIVSLFGWGCTGFQDTQYNSFQYYYLPYDTEEDDDVNNNNGSYYGPSGLMNRSDLSVDRKSDWGYVANQAHLGGFASGWRTLTSQEWNYLYRQRKVTVNNEQKDSYGEAIVEGVKGFVFLPDDWDGSVCASFVYGTSLSKNVFNSTSSPTWEAMESAGAVFLPISGLRDKTQIWGPNDATYWTSSACYYSAYPWNADALRFYVVDSNYAGDIFIETNSSSRDKGMSVRLVRDVD
jgi:hypothetical protein